MTPSLHDPLFCRQLVANAPDGEQISRLAGVVLNLFANLAHEYRDGILVHLRRFAPSLNLQDLKEEMEYSH